MKTDEHIQLTIEDKKRRISEYILNKLIDEAIQLSKSHINSSPLIKAKRNVYVN